MAYIFVVDETNFWKCLKNKIFGVPNNIKAFSQIMNVKDGDKLFLYVFKQRKIFGVYKAKNQVFKEENPQNGPWIGRGYDGKHGFYPYRTNIEIIKEYSEGVPIEEIENMKIGVTQSFFNGKSVGYLTEKQTEIIETLLEEINKNKPSMEISFEKFDSHMTPLNASELLKEETEEALQLLVQQNLNSLESGLKILDTYFPIKGYGWEGQIDILTKDKNKDYLIIELKLSNLEPEIWSQIFSYSTAIRNIYASEEGVDVRNAVIGKGFTIKTLHAYPEIKKLIKNKDSLKVFTFNTDYKTYVELSEININS